MVQCPVCRVSYVANTLFCTECGLYLLEELQLGTDPLETTETAWRGEAEHPHDHNPDVPDSDLFRVRLRIRARTLRSNHLSKSWGRVRELEVSLAKPVRLGRLDPGEDIYPEVDLTADLALEHGVSREHACIFRRGHLVEVEDLGSTNGTLLNGERLAPYLPVPLHDGDQLQLGKLLIDVSFQLNNSLQTLASNGSARRIAA